MTEFNIDWGLPALVKFTREYDAKTILDIGSGDGEHKRFMEYFGKEVYSVDFDKDADYCGDFLEVDLPKFDGIWCSHVLEHQRNVGLFLKKIKSCLKPNGVLALTVPMHSSNVFVAGHVTSWSLVLLLYNLVLAGFNCKNARVMNSYELSLILEYDEIPEVGDSVIGGKGEDPFSPIKEYFPMPVCQGLQIDGHGTIDWEANKTDGTAGVTVNCRFTEEPIRL